MSARVALSGCAGYERRIVIDSIQKLIDSLGGIGEFVKPGEKVLLNPNLLAPMKPEKAVTTHPEVVRAVAVAVIEAGGKPFIADSPAVPGFKMLAKVTGMAEIGKELGIPVMPLSDSVEYKQGDKKIYRILEISRQVLEADRIISIAKLKTHSQMYMTMGVKNIFGCVVGQRKVQWHFKAGIDRIFFARMIVELHQAVSPDLNILDGIIGMEGDGPGGSGIPRKIGLLSASTDAFALDRVMLDVVGAKPESLFTNQVASEEGIGETDIAKIEIVGDGIESFRINDFIFPKMVGLMPIPGILKKFMTNQLTSKPKEDLDKCTMCDRCIEICPTDVISSVDKKRLAYDYDKCIRCFCCVEVCPEGAMKPAVPWLLKLVG